MLKYLCIRELNETSEVLLPPHVHRPPTVECENILVVRFKSIGDILFTLPAIAVLRDNFPHAKITFLTSKENVPLVSGFCDIDEIIGIDRSIYRRWKPKAIVRETLSLLRRLRAKKFSLAVDFQGYGETGLITRLTGAKDRWGTVYRRARGWVYTRGVRRENRIHPADWNLSLLRQCGLSGGPVRNEFVVPDAASEEARRFLVSHGLDSTRATLFIQPFTSTPAKNWPLEKFLRLADHWRDRNVQVMFGGGPADREVLGAARGAGYTVAAGVPLIVTSGLIQHSDVIIGGDTGFLHIAVAMNKRVVMLTRSADHCKCHPFQHPDWVIHPIAGKDISRITLGAVVEACGRAFTETLGARPVAHDAVDHAFFSARPVMAPSTEALPAP